MSVKTLQQRLAGGELVFLDGAVGTELSGRGAAMSVEAWCGPATEHHTNLLREIHEDYIRAGAQVITANTFATHRTVLEAGGLGDQVERLNRLAVTVALEARENANAKHDVVVAASMSHMLPHRNPPGDGFDQQQLGKDYQEIATIVADAGCELIILEMMSHPGRIALAARAAASTGLPFWMGLSATEENGELVAYVPEHYPFEDVVKQVVDSGATAIGIMHTRPELTGPALEVVRKHWSGPLLAYPDSGHFAWPGFEFEEVIKPHALVEYAQRWVDDGVQIVGGCCGLGVEHIREMVKKLG